eukprot:CAMPEP_0185837470 /NCGR_PEP_ID=MMETSP1353-20130828/11443_1 /TAXON_ID=1077150 /ORGANISM="Erythrolobus australicus, Strain CCMP3124" /LENGTH=209 /DNA_ID=CAMNT_0028536383 /DNA_START=120 /DNA_END=745 /DNA_ORIENTATION=+
MERKRALLCSKTSDLEADESENDEEEQSGRNDAHMAEGGASERRKHGGPDSSFTSENPRFEISFADHMALANRIQRIRESEVARERSVAQNWRTGKCEHRVVAQLTGDSIRKARFHENTVALGSVSGQTHVFDMRARRPLISFSAHHLARIEGREHVTLCPVSALDYDGKLVASGGTDGSLVVCCCKMGYETRYPPHDAAVTSVVLTSG